MEKNPLLELSKLGQSVWLDYLSRDLLTSGRLLSFIENDGVSGLTSNPAIFLKAITQSGLYREEIIRLCDAGLKAKGVYEALAVSDVGRAADELRPRYERSGKTDGFVSIEVDPHLAHDAEGTMAEARRLWAKLARPNILIKVPATDEGLAAVSELLFEGINVNVTLLFGLKRYGQVMDAYLAGLEKRQRAGKSLTEVMSVASFFVSRMDTLADELLAEFAQKNAGNAEVATNLQGKIAVACARIARSMSLEFFSSERFLKLGGARPQRLLWASTGTKNPAYSDVKYVDALVGRDTINTLPLETLAAYRDHGAPHPRLDEGLGEAKKILSEFSSLGFELQVLVSKLEREGEGKFDQPFDELLAAISSYCLASGGISL